MHKDFRNETDRLVFKMRDRLQHELQAAAPGPATQGKLGPIPEKHGPGVPANARPRSGRLRQGIRPVPIKRSGSGNLDRRVNVVVESRSPHTIYVVRGAKEHTGTGGKGTGMYLPGVQKRSRYGYWPGFQANDFISEGARNANRKIDQLAANSVRTMTRRFKRRLG